MPRATGDQWRPVRGGVMPFRTGLSPQRWLGPSPERKRGTGPETVTPPGVGQSRLQTSRAGRRRVGGLAVTTIRTALHRKASSRFGAAGAEARGSVEDPASRAPFSPFGRAFPKPRTPKRAARMRAAGSSVCRSGKAPSACPPQRRMAGTLRFARPTEQSRVMELRPWCLRCFPFREPLHERTRQAAGPDRTHRVRSEAHRP